MPNTSRTTYKSTSRSTTKNTTRSTTTSFNTSHNTTTSYTTTYGTSRGTSRTTTYNTYYNTSHTTTYNTEWSVSTSHQTTAQTTTTFNTTYYTTYTQNTTIFTNTNTVVNTAVNSGSVTTSIPVTRSTTFFRPKEVSQTNLMLNLDARVSAGSVTWKDQSGNNRHATPTSISSVIPSVRCVALYNFHSSAIDLTGNNTGTETAITYGGGNFGQGAVFNGTNAQIDTTATLIPNSTDFSLSFWIKPENQFGSVLARGLVTSGSNAWGFVVNFNNSANKLSFFRHTGGAYANEHYAETATNSITIGVWQHVVLSFDKSAGAPQFYIDGSAATTNIVTYAGGTGSAMATGNIAFNSSYDGGLYRLGNRSNGGLSTSRLKATLDQVRVFNKLLSSSEVTQLYNENSSTFKKVDIFNDATDGHYNLDGTDSFYITQFITDQNFTIGGWFYRNSAGGSAGYETLWSQGYTPAIRCQIYGANGSASGNRLYIYLSNGSSNSAYDTGIDLPTGEWFHLMKTYDLSAGTVKVYLNSALKKTQSTMTGTFYSSGNSDALFRIAKNSSNNNGYINGKISQVRVYDSVLTDAQIIDDYSTHDYLYV